MEHAFELKVARAPFRNSVQRSRIPEQVPCHISDSL